MKIYDLMKAARENPEKYAGKKYKVTNGYGLWWMQREYHEFEISTQGYFINNACILSCCNDTEVEEIPQWATFQEAMQAWLEGKTIRFVSRNGVGVTMFDVLHMDRKYVKDSKWYIEGES